MGKIIEFPSQEELKAFLVAEVMTLHYRSIQTRGTFHMALSGGRSILPVLEGLRTLEINWQRCHLYQVDERLVPPDSEDSNQRLLREQLTRFVDIPERNLHFVEIMESPEQSASAYERLLRKTLPEGGFDLVVLGLGRDCHVASLFPETPQLTEDHALVVGVKAERVPHARVSLTFSGLSMAGKVFLLVVGREKLQAYRMLTQNGVSELKCPGRKLLRQDNCTALVAV